MKWGNCCKNMCRQSLIDGFWLVVTTWVAQSSRGFSLGAGWCCYILDDWRMEKETCFFSVYDISPNNGRVFPILSLFTHRI
jgi:hypothetical protein